jgi:hypothetical protein
MIADRLHGEPANRPDSEDEQGYGAKRPPATGIERRLRQARRHKAFDIDVLPIGVVAGAIECFERMLIGGLGEFSLGVERFVRSEFVR